MNAKGQLMLHYAVVCFIAAILAATFGFSGNPGAAAAKVVFFTFIALFLVALAVGVVRRGPRDHVP
jgi:uncharacterized membrane protein YtjA (UPF0391 family)